MLNLVFFKILVDCPLKKSYSVFMLKTYEIIAISGVLVLAFLMAEKWSSKRNSEFKRAVESDKKFLQTHSNEEVLYFQSSK
jgi:hypothetical protein